MPQADYNILAFWNNANRGVKFHTSLSPAEALDLQNKMQLCLQNNQILPCIFSLHRKAFLKGSGKHNLQYIFIPMNKPYLHMSQPHFNTWLWYNQNNCLLCNRHYFVFLSQSLFPTICFSLNNLSEIRWEQCLLCKNTICLYNSLSVQLWQNHVKIILQWHL